MAARAIEGEPLLNSGHVTTFFKSLDNSAKLVLIAAVLVAARAVWRIGTRFNLRHRNEIILKDKPPVLLLRSVRR